MSRANLGAAVLAGIVLNLVALSVAEAQPYQEALEKSLGLQVKGPFVDRGDGVVWQQEFRVSGSTYLRLIFGGIQSPPGLQYDVVMRSGEDRVLARYRAAEFGRQAVFYTGVLFSDTVRVELEGKAPLSGLAFRVETVLYQVDLQGRTSALSLVPDWRNVLDLSGVPDPAADLVTRAREAVAKLYMGSGAVCTGFLVSSSALLTNFHCLNESTEYQRTRTQPSPGCRDIEMQFDFNRQLSPDPVVKTQCRRVVTADKEVDIAVLEVDPAALSSGKITRRSLRLANRPATPSEELLVIHHPGGLAKQFSFACRAFPVNDTLVEHDCSTIPGSSGAALIARDGTVVGIHYAGPYDDSLTVGEINAMVRRGHIFRNKARPMPIVVDRIRGFVP